MGLGKNWFGLGIVLLILSFIDVAFLRYENHAEYGILVAIWAVVCFILALRAEMKGR